MKTGAEILIECLLEQDVKTVFGYPGGAVLNIYDALYRYSDKITHILTAHEQGACHAADGFARSTGKTGVVIATSGPGATNLVTGLATAYMDSVPLVAVTGNVAVDLLGRDSFQEVDITGITTPVTKHNFIVKDIADLADTVRAAFRIAGSGRKGPVLIDIPKDVTAQKYEYHPRKHPAEPVISNAPDSGEISAAAELIDNAKRPMLYVGGGAVASGAAGALAEFAHKLQIPVSLSLMGLGAFPAADPLNLGMIGMHGTCCANRASHECDVMIVAGARFSDRVAGNREKFCGSGKIIHLDIDPAEFRKNVRADRTVKGDLTAVLKALTAICRPVEKGWIDEIRQWDIPRAKPQAEDGYPRPREIIETVSRLADDPIVVTDVGQHQMWVAQCFPFEKPRRLLTSGGLGTMGYGLGAAIGAQIGNPGKRVILFSGDGSFHMNLNELVTLSSYHLPVVILLMNNQVLGMVRQWQKAFYERRFSATDPHRKTDFQKLAEAFGIAGMKIGRPEEIEPVLRSALEQNSPVLVDCRISPDANVLPMIPPGGTAADMMVEMD